MNSAGMPGPWSRTPTFTLPPSRLLLNTISPPFGEYLMALVMRLVMTWNRRSESPTSAGMPLPRRTVMMCFELDTRARCGIAQQRVDIDLAEVELHAAG